MITKRILLLAVLLVGSVALSACGPTEKSLTFSCSGISGTYIAYGETDPGYYTFEAYAGSVAPANFLGSATGPSYPADAEYTVSGTFNRTLSPGTTIILRVYADGDYEDETGSCANQAVTWFNPGDGRADGQPADRIVGYCNAASKAVTVYGVTDDSKGVFLATFNYSDLLKAGAKGIYVDTHGNGTVSVSTDNQGNLWMAWNGGPSHADGNPKNGFAKSINCGFTS